jgi:hypothetical protein
MYCQMTRRLDTGGVSKERRLSHQLLADVTLSVARTLSRK